MRLLLQEFVEKVTAADDRRHNTSISQMFHWIFLKEMIAQAEETCEKDYLIPSASLVRLQFAPSNPYTHRALNFTPQINVQYKIQHRKLRGSYLDAHYCAAQVKYLKEMSVECETSQYFFFFVMIKLKYLLRNLKIQCLLESEERQQLCL